VVSQSPHDQQDTTWSSDREEDDNYLLSLTVTLRKKRKMVMLS